MSIPVPAPRPAQTEIPLKDKGILLKQRAIEVPGAKMGKKVSDVTDVPDIKNT